LTCEHPAGRGTPADLTTMVIKFQQREYAPRTPARHQPAMTGTPLRIDDFGPITQAAMERGEEVALFDVTCSIQTDRAHISAVTRTPDEVSDNAKALLAALQSRGEAVTETLRRGSAPSKIAWTREHFGETTLFTVSITGTAAEDGTVRTQETMIRSKTFEGIPLVRTTAGKFSQMCGDAVRTWGAVQVNGAEAKNFDERKIAVMVKDEIGQAIKSRGR